jgi:hypothetical protein
LIAEKKMKEKETYVWKQGMPQWDLAENVSEVQRLILPTKITVNDGQRQQEYVGITYKCPNCGTVKNYAQNL